jgi:hypothetical protein
MKHSKYLLLFGILAFIEGCNDDISTSDFKNGTSPRATTYPITGTIQAENYAQMSGIQTETTTDTGGGQNVGYIDANDWMIYNVNVPTAGSYKVYYRVASLSGGGNLQLERGGGGLTYGTLAIPSTGGWQNWTTISHTVTLSAGNQSIAIKANSGGWNINWWGIATTSGGGGNGGGTLRSTYFTSYGYNDNDDGNGHYGTATIAYPNSHHSIATEGTGTYSDPITFATDPREIAPGTIIYVPYLQKYFQMEDGCAECTTDWNNGQKWRTDLFMGGNTSLQPEPALSNCEDFVTRNDIMYINAGPGYTVDTTPLFSSTSHTCTAHIH